MPDVRPSHLQFQPISPAASQAGEKLAGILVGCTSLDECCRVGLEFFLETAQLFSGVLIVQSIQDPEPVLLVQQGLDETWIAQLQDPASSLRRAAQELLLHENLDPPKHLHCAAAIPIAAETGAEGVLLIQGLPCPPEVTARLAGLAPALGCAIRTQRLFAAQRLRFQEAANLQAELAGLAASADAEQLQIRLIQGVSRLLQSDAAVLVLLDEANPGWMTYKTLDSEAKWALHLQPDEGKGPVSECIRSGETIRLEGERAWINFDPTCTGQSHLQARSLLCAPLQTAGKPLGALLVLNKQVGNYDEYDGSLLSAIAALTGSGLQASRQIQGYQIAGAEQTASRWEIGGIRSLLQAIFDNLPASLYIIDRDYRLVAVGRHRAELLGATAADWVGQTCFSALFNRDEPCPECRVHEVFFDAQVVRRAERRRMAGHEITDWEIEASPVLDELGQVVQAILHEQDVTENHRLEAILTQSEKLAAVGQLAAGIAHEISNPLTAIIANAQLLRRDLPPGSDLLESVDLISRAGARAAQVVRNLLDFARKEEYRLGPVDVNETIERAIELVQHELLARGVLLQLHLDPDLPSIRASADYLQSVWLNLLLNAIDSLDMSPGVLQVATRKIDAELHVSVTDNGKGITPDQLSRVFEPFFTTKAPGRGTGLGLSVSHRIIQQHGGHFHIESQPGQGSTFTVILPLT